MHNNSKLSTTVLLAGLMFANIFPYDIHATAIEDVEEKTLKTVEQPIQKVSINFNLNTTALCATMLAYGIEGLITEIPAHIAAMLIIVYKGADLKNIDDIQRIGSQVLTLDPFIGRILGITAWLEGAKACLETDQNTSIKDIFKQAFKRVLPLTTCRGMVQFINVLINGLAIKSS